MAITLPKPSPKAFTELPSRRAVPLATQVPAAVLKSDPGLNVPEGAFQDGLSHVGELAPGISKMAQAAMHQQTREELVSRSSAKNGYRQMMEDEYQNTLTTQDFSKGDTLRSFGEKLSSIKMIILDSHTGSEDSRAMLEVSLGDLEADYIGRASGESVRLGKAHLEKALGDDMEPLLRSVMNNPSTENLQDQMLNSDRLITNEYAVGLTPDEIPLRIDAGREMLASRFIDSKLRSGKLDEAQAAFSDPLVFDSLSEQARLRINKNINTAIDQRNEINIEVAKATAVEKAKAEGRASIIKAALNPALSGAPSIAPETEAAYQGNYFADGTVEATGHYAEAMRLFGGAHKLYMSGMTSEANGLMSSAKFIMENSPAIDRAKEREKPISMELSSSLGLPMGTTMGEVMGMIPPSPAEEAAEVSGARALAKEKVKGARTISFINEADFVITELLDDIKIDPKLVGVVGSIRKGLQTTKEVMLDVGADTLVDTAEGILWDDPDIDPAFKVSEEAIGMFDVDDPNISVMNLIENSIAMILARLSTPQGQRIPVDVIKDSRKLAKLTGMQGSKQVQTRLEFLKKMLQRRKERINKRIGEDGGPSWIIIDGQVVKKGAQ